MNNEPAPVPKGRVMAFGIYLIVLNLALIYVLVRIWRPTPRRGRLRTEQAQEASASDF